MSLLLRDVRQGLVDYQAWATDPQPRIPLGLPFFDKATRGGIAKAEVAMVLAYSSVGKTSLALNMIATNPNVPTLFVSIEMSWRLVMARLAAIGSGVPTWELEAEMQAGRIPQAIVDTQMRFPFLLGVDKSEISVKEMVAFVKEASDRLHNPIRLIVIDYMELVGGNGMLGKSEQVDKVAVKIRALAKDTDSAVVVLHQVKMGDGSNGHKPLSLDSGRYGGHQPMDYVIGAYAPRLDRDLSERGVADVQEELYLQLLKNRSGQARPTGVKHRQNKDTGKVQPWMQAEPTFNTPQYAMTVGYQPPLHTPTRPDYSGEEQF